MHRWRLDRLLVLVLTTMHLSGCVVMETVLDPYFFKVVKGSPVSTYALVWAGNHDVRAFCFVKVDGKGMPSRNLAGYPQSLALLPGDHIVRVLLQVGGTGFLYMDREFSVRAGHTYVVNPDPALNIDDLGDKSCRLEPVGLRLASRTKLICE